jgi:hypothetical protein
MDGILWHAGSGCGLDAFVDEVRLKLLRELNRISIKKGGFIDFLEALRGHLWLAAAFFRAVHPVDLPR